MHSFGKAAFSASVAMLAFLPASLMAGPDEPAGNRRISLNGEWTFSIHGEGRKKIVVPSTYLPVGGATLERDFDLPELPAGRRVLLRFDGIVMTGKVFVNGHELGEYGPYTPFSMDVTDQVESGENHLRVELTDLGGFKPWGRQWVTAFPRFGGIVRDVNLELKAPVYIENARLDYQLSEEFTRADCSLHVWVVNTSGRTEQLQLAGRLENAAGVQKFEAELVAAPGKSRHTVQFHLADLRPWSPDAPELYELVLKLRRPQEELDRFTALTGFKEFVARGRDFFLNGEKFFVKGIFRHDIYGDQGHTLSRTQMEAEIADIKSLGCNFLRLGHYPQHRYITELAARHGLLTSGEPPVFGLNQKDPKVVESAKFCLGGLIRRDWNNPAVAAWIISNEAGTDPGYMKEMVAFVRRLDPNRLLTIVDNAHWTEQSAPWQKYRETGIDFICQNGYGFAFNGRYAEIEKFLPDDLPYVISEWGGPNNSYASLLREGRYYLERSSLVVDQGPRIAGVWFWEYQDIPMPRFTEQGLLHWSVVDKFRRPYETYYALKSLYTGKQVLPPRGRSLVPSALEKSPRPLAPEAMERYPGYELLDLSGVVNSDRVIGELEAVSPLAYPQRLALGRVAVAGLPFLLERQLVALSGQNPLVEIPVGRAAAELEFLGHVCFNSLAAKPPASLPMLPYWMEGTPGIETPVPFKGYPQAGDFGEEIGQYVLVYKDGEREVVPLENGRHFADYRLYYGLSHIDAVAVATERVVTYTRDHGTKRYQMRLFSYRPKRPSVPIAHVEFRLKNVDYVPLLAAITVQVYDPAAIMANPLSTAEPQ